MGKSGTKRMIWPPELRSVYALLTDPREAQQPAGYPGGPLHPAHVGREVRRVMPMLRMRPPDAGFVGDTPVQYVLGQGDRPPEPVGIAGLLVAVQCHLADSGGSAALAEVVPEARVKPGGQAA